MTRLGQQHIRALLILTGLGIGKNRAWHLFVLSLAPFLSLFFSRSCFGFAPSDQYRATRRKGLPRASMCCCLMLTCAAFMVSQTVSHSPSAALSRY
ncbi:hypothetical protein Thiowin_02463 [Thiorhodovibrio winogradskyi]|uniref:Uncharacterized protein n=1 Tax=Thiorhodovibrio winogradskyi TaxID=77007 RepID=A0ABZ0SA82_9GAMM